MRMRFVPTPDNKYILVIDKVTSIDTWDDPLEGPWEAVIVSHDEVDIEGITKERWVEIDGVPIQG